MLSMMAASLTVVVPASGEEVGLGNFASNSARSASAAAFLASAFALSASACACSSLALVIASLSCPWTTPAPAVSASKATVITVDLKNVLSIGSNISVSPLIKHRELTGRVERAKAEADVYNGDE